jgi:hypothetical protein
MYFILSRHLFHLVFHSLTAFSSSSVSFSLAFVSLASTYISIVVLFSGCSVYFQIWKMRLCQIKNSNKIGQKSGEKRGEWCSLLVMMFGGAIFRVQYAFPKMVSEAVPHEK